MNPPGGGVYQWCGLDKLSKWTMCQVSCGWWRVGHVTTIPLSDWPGAGAGAGAGHGAPDGGDGGGRHGAAAGRGAGQVSCDWRGAGHVTTVLTSDWLAGAGCSSWGYTTTPPSHRASWRSSDLSCEQFHV